MGYKTTYMSDVLRVVATEAVALYALKQYVKEGRNKMWFATGIAMYALTGYFLGLALDEDNLVRVSALWDSLSNITIAGLAVIFGDSPTQTDKIGFGLSTTAAFVLTKR